MKKEKRDYVELAVQLFGAELASPLQVEEDIRARIQEAIDDTGHGEDFELAVTITMHSGPCVKVECGNDDAHMGHEEEPVYGAKP